VFFQEIWSWRGKWRNFTQCGCFLLLLLLVVSFVIVPLQSNRLAHIPPSCACLWCFCSCTLRFCLACFPVEGGKREEEGRGETDRQREREREKGLESRRGEERVEIKECIMWWQKWEEPALSVTVQWFEKRPGNTDHINDAPGQKYLNFCQTTRTMLLLHRDKDKIIIMCCIQDMNQLIPDHSRWPDIFPGLLHMLIGCGLLVSGWLQSGNEANSSLEEEGEVSGTPQLWDIRYSREV